MAYNNMEQLLEKYWVGETTLQEEKQLKDFFNNGQVPAHLAAYQPMFQFFETESKKGVSDEFDQKILETISTPKPVKNNRRNLIFITLIVATMLIGFGVNQYFNTQKITPIEEEQPIAYSLEDLTDEEREAYFQAKSALLLVSKKLNKGAALAVSGVIKTKKELRLKN